MKLIGKFLHAKLFLVIYFSLSLDVYAKTIHVSYVIDGDTIVYKEKQDYKKVRLSCIDAPEIKQPYGLESKLALKELIGGKTVEIAVSNIDKYGREIANITYQNQDVNLRMVSSGNAWVYEAFCRDQPFYTAQMYSKSHKIGLWATINQVAPWVFRREQHGINK
ncbi:thermonuclease family protein [Salmonella enterica subsp. enterica]|nr:thermonuclease family protein [Salmonella enterica subsp. enterica serovar Muenchen]